MSVVFPIEVVLWWCTVAYAIPGTSVQGAILLTGYLGGATSFDLADRFRWVHKNIRFDIQSAIKEPGFARVSFSLAVT